MNTEIPENNLKQQNPEPTLKEKTAKGLFWGGMGNLLQQIIGMVFGIIIARILNPDDYGLVAMLTIFSAIATTFIDSGFSVALINKKDADHKDYNAVFWFGILIGLGIYLILFFVSPLIARFFKQPELTNLSRLVFLGFIINSAGIVHNAILLKNMMVKQIGIANILGIFFSGIVGLLLALNGYAYWGLAIQQISFLLFSVLLRWYFLPWRPTLRFNFSPLREMMGFSSKLFATNIISQVQWNLFAVLLGKFYNPTQLGYYSQGTKWMNMVSAVISGMTNMVAQPVFVQANDDNERFLRVFRKMTRFVAFVTFPVFIGLSFIAPEFIQITIGEKWTNSIIFLQLMCGWGGMAPFILLYTQLLISHHKSDIILKGSLIISLSQMFIITVMFFMKASILHIVACYVATFCLSYIYWYHYGSRLIGIRWTHIVKDIFPYLITTLFSVFVSMLILFHVKNLYIVFTGKILLFVGIYLIVLYIFDSKMLKDSIVLLKHKTIN
ncbi:MAG: lipopolysaccharide biosynthesis protein [Bacteroidales bacterium]|jgi:O-antigen/teichoic acid export membrane protein|nr:lipopolysaccharide biosynthesis protein [Bacteroidales bacterium]